MPANKKALLAVIATGLLVGSLAFLLSGNPSGAAAPSGKFLFGQAIGKPAPDFSLEGMDGKTVKLSDYRGKNVLLFFNEGSMCYPACWDQMKALADDKRFDSGGTVFFSIVTNAKSEWQSILQQVPKFADANILFDTSKSVSKSYDVLNLRSSMHPGSLPGHTYFLIDKSGIVRYALDDPQMAIRNDNLAAELAKLS